MMRSSRQNEAARRFNARRHREDEAPRLHAEVPALVSLDLTMAERRGETMQAPHVRRVVVAAAPALFEVPCGDPSCVDGGHDLTPEVMRALAERQTSFEGTHPCGGHVGASPCVRALRYVAAARYHS